LRHDPLEPIGIGFFPMTGNPAMLREVEHHQGLPEGRQQISRLSDNVLKFLDGLCALAAGRVNQMP
jgi:hypothetical protein